MAARLHNPFEQYWSSTAAYSGGVLRFYASGTSTPLAVYSDAALSASLGTSVTLNSAGRPATAIFLQNLAYKVTLEDSAANLIWTADPVSSSDFALFPKWTIGSANPNGSVAGTKGSSGVPPDVFWDATNNILYLCTTTGSTSTAVWTALNASAATPAVPPPQGRLTLTSGTPVLASDASAQSTVYYTPYVGNLVPIYNGVTTTPTVFAELSLSLVASHAANTLYDVFVFSNSGVLTLVTGPAWSSGTGGSITAGSCARGTGAGGAAISRVNGLWVNTVSMTGRNGSTTYSIGANLATYVGTIYIDAAGTTCTCHVAWGQSRRWGVWNAYNRVPITLRMGDSTATWNYTSATIRQSNAAVGNVLTVFAGLAEESFDLRFDQNVAIAASSGAVIGVGYNSTTAFSGKTGLVISSAASISLTNMAISSAYMAPPAIGINNITANEQGGGAGTTTFSGTSEAAMLLSARWNG